MLVESAYPVMEKMIVQEHPIIIMCGSNILKKIHLTVSASILTHGTIKPELPGFATSANASRKYTVNTRPIPVIKALSDVLTFGKYKGKTVKQLLHDNPGYICWLSNYDVCKIPDRIYEKARLAEYQNTDGYGNGGWSGADWDWATGLFDPPY